MDVDLLVIGGGSAGFGAAQAGADLGARVALAEPGDLGGTCVNRGCLPKKALVRSAELARLARGMADFGVATGDVRIDWARAVDRKDDLLRRFRARDGEALRKRGILWIPERVRFRDPKTLEAGAKTIRARRVVVATGSRPIRPDLPGIERAMDSAGLLDLRTVPPRLVIIGGGMIAMEFASLFGTLGSRVTVLEARPRILEEFDGDLRTAIVKASPGWNVTIRPMVRVTRIDALPEGLRVAGASPDGDESFEADEVLVAVGRGPGVEGLNLEGVGVEVGPKGLWTDAYLQTSVPGIYAAGDVHGRFQLTPVSHYEGDLAARNALLGNRRRVDYRVVPRTLFTIPSASSVGLTEEEALKAGLDVATSLLPFAESGAAAVTGSTEGFVKLLIDRRRRTLAGAHILARDSEDLIHLPTLAMKARLKLSELTGTLAIHPSLSERFFDAVSSADLRRKAARRAS